MSQMTSITQQTATNAEESSSAAEALKDQAERMREIVQELLHLANGSSQISKKEELPSIQLNRHAITSGDKNLRIGQSQPGSSPERVKGKTKIVSPEEVVPFRK